LFQQFLDADTIVFLPRSMLYSVNSHLKVFLDRTLALARSRGLSLLPGAIWETSYGTLKSGPKKMAVVVVGAFKGNEIFSSNTL